MKEIPLTQGQVAVVCDCHAHLVDNHKWCALWDKDKKSFRAIRATSVAERLRGAPRSILMHVVINQTPRGLVTDHVNHNTLDNRCSNLRTATPAENNYNRVKHNSNSCGYKGVFWSKQRNKWLAQIGFRGRKKYLGLFETAEDAARAYDTAARELHGEFAQTNF